MPGPGQPNSSVKLSMLQLLVKYLYLQTSPSPYSLSLLWIVRTSAMPSIGTYLTYPMVLRTSRPFRSLPSGRKRF